MGLDFDVRPASVDEAYLPGERPEAHVERLARSKAEAVAREAPEALVVGGDTVVLEGDRVLGKPADPDEAVEMLTGLSGRDHRVLSALAVVVGGRTRSAVSGTTVRFRSVDEEDARAYVATGEPLDKAGGYGIQGLGAALVESIEGDYYTVVGFPVGVFLDLLEASGWRYTFGRRLEPIGADRSGHAGPES